MDSRGDSDCAEGRASALEAKVKWLEEGGLGLLVSFARCLCYVVVMVPLLLTH